MSTLSLRLLRGTVSIIAWGLGTLTPMTWGQAPSAVEGTVTSEDGKPIPGVEVSGSDHAITNENGEFHVGKPGPVLHFWKEHFQPKTVVVGIGYTNVRVTMSSGNNFTVPACKKPQKEFERVGAGKYGVQFELNGKVKLHRGRWDVDYVRHVVTLPRSKSYMEFWFGPYAIDLTPDDEQFINSTDFHERNITGEHGSTFGEDSWGSLKDGGKWRQTAFAGEGGARYVNAQPDDAGVFDRIIDSACVAPYPKS